MTMLERVGSYSNEYFNSLIREYTDKSKAPESHGMNRAIHAYLNTNDLKVNELLVDDMPFMQDIDDFTAALLWCMNMAPAASLALKKKQEVSL